MAMLNNQRVSYSDGYLYIPIRSPLELSSWFSHTSGPEKLFKSISFRDREKPSAEQLVSRFQLNGVFRKWRYP